MTKLTKFILAIALQLVVIFAIIIFKTAVLTGGTEVLLKIRPVDPRSPLRGDYATFQYDELSNLRSLSTSSFGFRNGDTIYVFLERDGKYWRWSTITPNKPVNSNSVFIKGKVVSGGVTSQSMTSPYQQPNTTVLRVVYGVEEYFIPEGKGQNFSFQGKEVAASVAVDENGNAALKRIYVNGKSWP